MIPHLGSTNPERPHREPPENGVLAADSTHFGGESAARTAAIFAVVSAR